MLGETLTETARPGQAKTVTICMSYFMTGDGGKEHGTNKPPPTRRLLERSKGERGDASPHVLPISQNPPCWNLTWLSSCAHHQKGP